MSNIRSFNSIRAKEEDGDGDEEQTGGGGHGVGGGGLEIPASRVIGGGTAQDKNEVMIFHELQSGALCGQHCLNNLLQRHVFTEIELSEIALALDDEERRFMLEGTNDGEQMSQDALRFLAEDSSNVDSAGNFSIQVLKAALNRSAGVDLDVWTGTNPNDPTEANGFVVNRSDHWFTIRQIKGKVFFF